jgi:hypothetical protein
VSPQSAQLPVRRFLLAAAPPVRALAIAAGAEVLGALLLVGWQALDLPLVAAVVAGLLLAFGTVLLAAAVVLAGRLRTVVELTEDGVGVTRAGRSRSVPWSAVQEVKLQHPQLQVVTDDPAGGLVITNPRGATDPRFAALLEALHQRLEAERGHRPLEG